MGRFQWRRVADYFNAVCPSVEQHAYELECQRELMQSPRSMATAQSMKDQGIQPGTLIETEDGRPVPITRESIRAVALAAVTRGVWQADSLCTAIPPRCFRTRTPTHTRSRTDTHQHTCALTT